MGCHSTITADAKVEQSLSISRKRKRDQSLVAEIEVDVTASGPPSKKALRKARKEKSTSVTVSADTTRVDGADTSPGLTSDEGAKAVAAPLKRSEYGVWIGNLPWTATKLDLRSFLTKDTSIIESMITRIHMPPPTKLALGASRQRNKPQNQGFAYVDFSKKEALIEALALSEKLLTGRRLLIKDSKSFEGRPEKPKSEGVVGLESGKPPSKRVFVGNLGFNTTEETLKDHFARCGEILDIHIATFEDTGKCKGYAWVNFAEMNAGEAAVRGWINTDKMEKFGDEDEEITEVLADQVQPKNKIKRKKWWVNKLGGRPLRMEFAEGKDVRYKKHYGKDGRARKGEVDGDSGPEPERESHVKSVLPSAGKYANKKAEKAQRRIDTRKIKPGAALATTPRTSGSIVESQGQKIIFA